MTHIEMIEEIRKLPAIKQKLIFNKLKKIFDVKEKLVEPTKPRYDDLYWKFEEQFARNEG